MAEILKKELGVEAELEKGGLGEFSVWVDGVRVAKKKLIFFPRDKTVLTKVREALARS